MKEKNHKYKEVFSKSPIGILFYDKNGKLTDANPSALKIVGIPKLENISGISLFDNPNVKEMKDELLEKGLIKFKASLNFDTAQKDDYNIPKKFGTVFIDYIVSVTDSGFLVQMMDISAEEQTGKELKKSLHSESKTHDELDRVIGELRNSKEEYRVMAETVPYGVWKTDAKGNPKYASPAFLELIEMVLSDLKESGWIHKLPPEDVEPVIRKWVEHVKSGEMWDTEYKILGPDNEYHTVLARGLPIHDNEGNIISWVGINLDITERKEIEEKLQNALEKSEDEVKEVLLNLSDANKALELEIIRRLNAEEELKQERNNLEEQVKDRTAELSEALMNLKQSNRELQHFAYMASHDLQEPLRTISNFTQLLGRRYKDKLDSDAGEFIDYIIDASKRMQRLINELLEYSKVTSKEKEFKLANTEKIVEKILSDFHVIIEENNAEITYDSLPEVWADETLLAQVFQNLISNAIRYRKLEKTPKIHISAKKEDNEYICSVSDNGIGIEEQYKERIFTIFQRLHTREVYKGTGIGLAVVKGIVERHGGRVWVESSLGVGSTFYFTIPMKKY